MKYRVQVEVLPRRGILDPQGRAVADALRTLGFADVEEVHLGRHLVVELAAASADAARASVTAMCERLLANPVTEQFVVGAAETA
ncbi:MAG: phosphoribosylformylglycinamidine synthase subunit PurS [Gemmatimonadaceae bacterium]|nr:phosphoribosylformylglycinamidine synthase subunit PurS [Gemmatimonadaceae bacterium]